MPLYTTTKELKALTRKATEQKVGELPEEFQPLILGILKRLDKLEKENERYRKRRKGDQTRVNNLTARVIAAEERSSLALIGTSKLLAPDGGEEGF